MVEREVPLPFTKDQIGIKQARKVTRTVCFRLRVLKTCLMGQASKRFRVVCLRVLGIFRFVYYEGGFSCSTALARCPAYQILTPQSQVNR